MSTDQAPRLTFLTLAEAVERIDSLTRLVEEQTESIRRQRLLLDELREQAQRDRVALDRANTLLLSRQDHLRRLRARVAALRAGEEPGEDEG